MAVAPTGSWALKGGQALLARLGSEARTTKDTDGGLRYAILGLLDGREFERIQLDVNAVPDDQPWNISSCVTSSTSPASRRRASR